MIDSILYSYYIHSAEQAGAKATQYLVWKVEPVLRKSILYTSHCSKLEIVLNENDIPQNQQFLLLYTLVLPKESRLQKPVDIQG